MSRADRFDRGDFEVRYAQPRQAQDAPPAASQASLRPPDLPAVVRPLALSSERGHSVQWPIAQRQITRVGESVLADRNGRGRPHKGIDLFADAGTEVVAASAGEVLRVVDGRQSAHEARRRAGLFIDVRGRNALVFRYLHLGESRVQVGAVVRPGMVLGTVAPAHTSGLASAPHVHFEVRQGDYDPSAETTELPWTHCACFPRYERRPLDRGGTLYGRPR